MRFKFFIKFLITFGLLFYLFYYVVDLKGILVQFKKIKWHYYLGAELLYLLGVLFCTQRWNIVLKVKNIRLDYSKLLKYYFMGIFFNLFLPGTVGGDSVKILKITKEKTNERTELASSIIVERLFGLLAVYFIGILAILFNYKTLSPQVLKVAILILALFTLGFLLFFQKKLTNFFLNHFMDKFDFFHRHKNKCINFYNTLNFFEDFKNRRKELGQVIFMSFAFYFISYVGTVFLLLYSLDTPIPYFFLLSFLPILNLIVMLPISFSGIGVRESLYVYFLSFVDVSNDIAISLSILVFSLAVLNSLIGAFFNLRLNVR